MKLAFACHLLATFILATFGFVYLFHRQFMPYHADALAMPWREVSPAFQALVLALMKAVGGACLAVTVLELVLLFIPFRQGLRWARWAIPGGGLVACATSFYAMIFLALNTPATPPWIAPGAGALLLLAGLVLSLKE